MTLSGDSKLCAQNIQLQPATGQFPSALGPFLYKPQRLPNTVASCKSVHKIPAKNTHFASLRLTSRGRHSLVTSVRQRGVFQLPPRGSRDHGFFFTFSKLCSKFGMPVYPSKISSLLTSFVIVCDIIGM